jgi:polygalacturonase
MKIYNVSDFGAVGDGRTDNAIAIQAAIDECSRQGGGMVYFPGNSTFLSGPIDLKSQVNLHLESSAVLLANPDERIYTKSAFRENAGEGTIWIGGENAENVTISGSGTIHGNGIAFMGPEDKAAYILKDVNVIDPRPHLLTLINIKNLTIKEVTFKDSAYWCLHLIGCDQVNIAGIRILNNLKIRNSDGIDLDHTRNVRISNCHIESADDCICFKTRREYEEYGPTENIIVTGCLLTSTSCSIKLGSENMDAIRHVVVSDCIIRNSNRCIGIQNRDEGRVENVLFTNIIAESRLFDDVWWGKAEPIYVTAYRRASVSHKDSNVRFAKGQTVGRVGEVKNITFTNIVCDSENGIFVGGEKDKISNITFRNINLRIDKKTRYPGGMYDLRPSDTVGLLQTQTAGFYLLQARNISIQGSSVTWGDHRTLQFDNVLYAEAVDGLNVDQLHGESAVPDSEAIRCTNCTRTTIRP